MLSVPAALTRLPPGTWILGQHPTEREKKKKGGETSSTDREQRLSSVGGVIVKVNSLSIEKTLSVSTGGGQLSTRSRKEAQQKLSSLAVVVARCMTK